MSYSSGSPSNFPGGGQNNGNDEQDGYGGGKKSGSMASRLKKSSGTKKDADADEEYPKYANVGKDEADRYNSNGGSDGYNISSYNGGTVVRGGAGAGGYGNSSPYRGGGSGYGNSGGSSTAYSAGNVSYGNNPLPYGGNIVIHTNEVHLHHRAPPGYEYDGDNRNNDQRRRGGGGGGGGSGLFDRN